MADAASSKAWSSAPVTASGVRRWPTKWNLREPLCEFELITCKVQGSSCKMDCSVPLMAIQSRSVHKKMLIKHIEENNKREE
jgi:hypothetical protein